jgi:hypothetical protein
VSAGRTVTVQTSDHGPVTVPEPAWCVGEHVDGGFRVDIGHHSADAVMAFRGHTVLGVVLASYPFADQMPRGPLAVVELDDFQSFTDPAELEELAAALVAHAATVRAVAAQLAELLHAEDAAVAPVDSPRANEADVDRALYGPWDDDQDGGDRS